VSDDSPLTLCLNARTSALEIAWADGVTEAIPFRTLRSRCRCAECRNARRKNQPLQIVSDVSVVDAVPYGANAVQLVFSDGHTRGIFPFPYLRELGVELAHSNEQ
jgi:DUF971 family protein